MEFAQNEKYLRKIIEEKIISKIFNLISLYESSFDEQLLAKLSELFINILRNDKDLLKIMIKGKIMNILQERTQEK